MRFGQTLMIGLALNVALAAGVQADVIRPGVQANAARPGAISVSSGPYSAILSRNVFDLQQPPKVGQAPPPPPPLANVKLIGLMDISGRPQCVLSISEPGTVGKTPIPCIMSVNQMQSGVEVKDIDLATKSAKIQMGENVSLIHLEEPKVMAGGVVVPAGPGLGAGARPPGYPPGYPPTRPGGPGGFTTVPAGFSNPSLPGAYNPNAGGDPNAAVGGMGDAGAIPNRTVRTDPPMPVEQQINNMETQRQQLLEAGSPMANLLPVTSQTSPQALQLMNQLNQQAQGLTQPQQPASTTGAPGISPPTAPVNNGPAWGGPKYRGTLVPGGGQ